MVYTKFSSKMFLAVPLPFFKMLFLMCLLQQNYLKLLVRNFLLYYIFQK